MVVLSLLKLLFSTQQVGSIYYYYSSPSCDELCYVVLLTLSHAMTSLSTADDMGIVAQIMVQMG